MAASQPTSATREDDEPFDDIHNYPQMVDLTDAQTANALDEIISANNRRAQEKRAGNSIKGRKAGRQAKAGGTSGRVTKQGKKNKGASGGKKECQKQVPGGLYSMFKL